MADAKMALFGNTQLSEKLQLAINKFPVKKYHNKITPTIFKDPNFIGEDGDTHILLSNYSKTDIGKAISLEIYWPFQHDMLGMFGTISAFWTYISSYDCDEKIRSLQGSGLHMFSKNIVKNKVVNYKAIVMDACWQRVSKNPEIMEELKLSTLPFDVYYTQGGNGVRARPVYAAWFVEGYEEIRKAIKEDRSPNFMSLINDHSLSIEDSITSLLKAKADTVITSTEFKPKKPFKNGKQKVSKPNHNNVVALHKEEVVAEEDEGCKCTGVVDVPEVILGSTVLESTDDWSHDMNNGKDLLLTE